MFALFHLPLAGTKYEAPGGRVMKRISKKISLQGLLYHRGDWFCMNEEKGEPQMFREVFHLPPGDLVYVTGREMRLSHNVEHRSIEV